MLSDTADQEATPIQQANGAGEAGSSTDVVTLPLDPGESHKGYAAARAKGAVVIVAFESQSKDGSEGGEGGEQTSEFRSLFDGEHLFVARYDEVVSSLLDNRFSADPHTAITPEQREKMPSVPEELRPAQESLLSMDPPDHSRLRKLIQPSFSARAMEAMRPRIQKITDDLIDEAERAAEERGETGPNRRMDLIEAFAYPMPVTVISDMLGIPREDREQVKGWTENLLRADALRNGGMAKESRAKVRQFTDYLRDLFGAKRRDPGEDMITQLLQAEEDGDKLNEDEVLSTVFLLYIAGHVTTVNLVGNGVFALLSHPTEAAKLRADLGLARAVVEETLRYWGPVDLIGRRIAKEDLELGGIHIPKGEPIMIGLASANRDPARFADPDVFDITRPDADRHVAFGKGIHLCVGAPLARVEGQIAFEALFRRFPEMRLAIPAEEVRWGRSMVRGFASLPVLF
jgi:cytochrome P450